MIDIAIQTNELTTMFTLSSLLDKGENFRLHLFTRPQSWDKMQPVHKWALANFREVHIYQSAWNIKGTIRRDGRGHAQLQARMILQMKQHWHDKSHDMTKLLCLDHTPRIFTQSTLDKGQLPTVAQMGKNIAYFGRQWVYLNHPFFKNYYNILGIEAHEHDHDKTMILLDWNKIDKLDYRAFFKNGRATKQSNQTKHQKDLKISINKRWLEKYGPWHTDVDSFILSATNKDLFSSFYNIGVGYAPTYFNGKVDKLFLVEAMGAKDAINCNIMLRKAYTISLPGIQELVSPYWNIPTLFFLAMPWDLWAKQLDNIPTNLKSEVVSEQLLDKAERQRKMVESVTKAGYLYGKI